MDKPLIGCIAVIVAGADKLVGLECSKGRGLILPGGRWEVEKDRTYHHAASREAKEEVGLDCPAANLKYLWHGPDGFGYDTFSFLAYQPRPIELPASTPSGRPCFVTVNDLMQSKFAAYYAVLFDQFSLSYLYYCGQSYNSHIPA